MAREKYRRNFRQTRRTVLRFWLDQWVEQLIWRFKGRPDPGAAVVVAGSGRAGTTWLAQMLCTAPGTRLIFEPLHPKFVPAANALHNPADVLCSTFLRSGEHHPQWEVFFRRVLTGQLRNGWTNQERARLFGWRYVVKLIRANLMLGWLRKRFGCSLVFVVRHPCAVVRSRLVRGWSAPVERFLCQMDLLHDHLAPFETIIRAARSDVERHAVMWAVETWVALQQIQAQGGTVVFYETLCAQPVEQLRVLCAKLDLPFQQRMESAILRRSVVCDERGRDVLKEQMLGRWQQDLSISDQRAVLDIVGSIGLSLYDETPYPKQKSDVADGQTSLRLAPSARLERATNGFEVRYSVH